MKHLKLATICLGLALTVMVVTGAEAGKLDKRTEKSEEMKKPVRTDNYPTMHFMSGVLTRSPHTGWMIGETPLHVRKDCVITMEGTEEGMLEEGRKAVVMGSRVGEAISAWTISISGSDFMARKNPELEDLKEPGPDPEVGSFSRQPD